MLTTALLAATDKTSDGTPIWLVVNVIILDVLIALLLLRKFIP